MKIVVDLNRCQSYGQCVFAAPKVFHFHGEQSLEYDYNPDNELRVQVENILDIPKELTNVSNFLNLASLYFRF